MVLSKTFLCYYKDDRDKALDALGKGMFRVKIFLQFSSMSVMLAYSYCKLIILIIYNIFSSMRKERPLRVNTFQAWKPEFSSATLLWKVSHGGVHV